MADALEQFLEKRARDDYRDLELLRPLIADALNLEECSMKALFKMMKFANSIGAVSRHPEVSDFIEKNPDLFEHVDFVVDPETVRMAGDFGLNLAGEACKVIEQTRPYIVKKMPSFPWQTLKRLRNYHSHPARNSHDPELQESDITAIEEAVKKLERVLDDEQLDNVININNFGSYLHENPSLALSAGLRFYRAMRILNAHRTEDNMIPLYGTKAVKDACEVLTASGANIPIGEEVLPIMVIDHSSYIIMYEIYDTISRISSLHRWRKESFLNNSELGPLLTLRNQIAHFGGTMSLKDWDWRGNPRKYVDYTDMLQTLSTAIGTVPTSENAAAAENFIEDLAKEYKSNLLGNIATDPEKYEVLNNFVESIDPNTVLSDAIKNAYVQAAALMLQKMPAARAKDFLHYIAESPNSELKQPNTLSMDDGCPYVVRNNLKDFINNVLVFSAAPGTNRTVNGRMH